MERTNFLKFVQQKNQKNISKKPIVHVNSDNCFQNVDSGIFRMQSNSINNLLPTFINRKTKNLKPYSNHFKKLNFQKAKVQSMLSKNQIQSKPSKTQTSKTNDIIKAQKKKELQSIHHNYRDNFRKPSQISVYQQFLQRTNPTYSNMIQNLFQNHTNFRNACHKQKKIHQIKQLSEQTKNINTQRRSLGADYKFPTKQFGPSDIKLLNSQKNKEETFQTKQIFIMKNIKFLEENIQISMPLFKKQKSLKQLSHQIQSKKSIDILKATTIINDSPIQNQLIIQKDSPIQDQVIIQHQKAIQTVQVKQKPINNQIRIKFSPIKTMSKLKSDYLISSLKNDKKAIEYESVESRKDSGKQDSRKKIQTKVTLQSLSPPNVTAYSYIIYQASLGQKRKDCSDKRSQTSVKLFSNSKIISSLNSKSSVEIASLTKIMTFLLAIQICQKYNIKPQQQKVKIGKFQSNINGTSAQLQQGQIYTVENLMYGLMLPSGNDASLALANWAGKKLLFNQIKDKNKTKKAAPLDYGQSKSKFQFQPRNQEEPLIVIKKKKCYQRFIFQMNKKARLLGLAKTTYANSHGLANSLNKSCAYDLAILCQYAMKNPKFKKVVSTIQYSCVIQAESSNQISQDFKNDGNQDQRTDYTEHENANFDQQNQQICEKANQKSELVPRYIERKVKWQNTHKLITKQQYIGIKTGITNTAGPCLASCIKTLNQRYFIIIVLNSKKINYRFKDTQTLRKWLFKAQKLTHIKQSALTKYPSMSRSKQQIDQSDD